ncbi:hypothetical protein C791_4618 [Amycolatopsis azurea DSM 43854]|uniref:Glyoxalase-like domain-containing protein n=1 Tax=Amycolatopsis azurea DSM 43854 TaxID=1238180 RepID=M2PMH9_9PSEU|nr:hypothetical protein C791_4618 [Amycolatopsis azurea DSM 43854]
MRIRYQVVTFDAADLSAESRFWAGVLGGVVEDDGDWHMVTISTCGSKTSPKRTNRSWPSAPRC